MGPNRSRRLNRPIVSVGEDTPGIDLKKSSQSNKSFLGEHPADDDVGNAHAKHISSFEFGEKSHLMLFGSARKHTSYPEKMFFLS